MVGKIRNEV